MTVPSAIEKWVNKWIIHSYYDLFTQLCLALWEPMDCSPPYSSVHGTLQARIFEWVSIPFSRGSPQPRDWTWVPHIAGRLFTSWDTREASQEILVVKNPPENTGDIWVVVWSLGQEDSLEEGMATHFSILAWRISWTEEPCELQSTESQRVRHDWSDLAQLLFIIVVITHFII